MLDHRRKAPGLRRAMRADEPQRIRVEWCGSLFPWAAIADVVDGVVPANRIRQYQGAGARSVRERERQQ